MLVPLLLWYELRNGFGSGLGFYCMCILIAGEVFSIQSHHIRPACLKEHGSDCCEGSEDNVRKMTT